MIGPYEVALINKAMIAIIGEAIIKPTKAAIKLNTLPNIAEAI